MADDAERENLLLKKAKSGDMDAFGELIRNYEKAVYNIAYRIMGNYDDALDMSQEALLKIYKNIGKCADIEHFRKWMYAIINNCCIDEFRKRKNRKSFSFDEGFKTDDGMIERQIESEDRLPEQILLDKELASELEAAISKLSHEHKSIIVMRDIKGLSYDELAFALNCGLGTVKSRLSRARFKLKEILKQNTEQNNRKNVFNYKSGNAAERR